MLVVGIAYLAIWSRRRARRDAAAAGVAADPRLALAFGLAPGEVPGQVWMCRDGAASAAWLTVTSHGVLAVGNPDGSVAPVRIGAHGVTLDWGAAGEPVPWTAEPSRAVQVAGGGAPPVTLLVPESAVPMLAAWARS